MRIKLYLRYNNGEACGENAANRAAVNQYLISLEAWRFESFASIAATDPVLSGFPKQLDVMHWHNDMPDIADGIKLLAKSEGCPRQIFRFGDRVYGFQCHFELTKELVESMVKHCGNDFKAGKYVMTPDQLMKIDYSKINAHLDKVLDYLSNVN